MLGNTVLKVSLKILWIHEEFNTSYMGRHWI